MARLTDAYTSPPQPGSGIDWDTLFKVVVDRYAERLEIARYTLNSTDGANALATAKSRMAQLRIMLAPYILHSAVPSTDLDGRCSSSARRRTRGTSGAALLWRRVLPRRRRSCSMPWTPRSMR
ncbi:hypothetical protein C8J57DRAFT_1366695 [Mycena rebaudengoi]|nr:hypothetical protein C8J57DRAFT_1366695 [Mycena rebaudengoi]